MTNQYVTAKQAADMTGLSERTIRRYIANGRTPARKIAPNRFAIAIEDLPIKQIRPDIGPDKTWAALEELQRDLRDAKARISALERVYLTPTDSGGFTSTQRTNNTSQQSSSRGLPPDLVSLNSFCADHRININTVKAAIKRGELSFHSGSWKVGSTRVEYALDENEQAAVLERYG